LPTDIANLHQGLSNARTTVASLDRVELKERAALLLATIPSPASSPVYGPELTEYDF